MTLEQLLEKLTFYKQAKLDLEAKRKEQLGNIEQKVLEYRLELTEELEKSVNSYADKLHEEYEKEFSNDLTKADNYIELLENLIKDITTKEEDNVNESNN